MITSEEKLIADFMGYKLVAERAPGKRALVRRDKVDAGARFNESWEWLIPVVERIGEMGYFVQIQFDVMFKEPCACIILRRNTPTVSIKGSDLMDTIYKCVVTFIKIYNKEK